VCVCVCVYVYVCACVCVCARLCGSVECDEEILAYSTVTSNNMSAHILCVYIRTYVCVCVCVCMSVYRDLFDTDLQ